MFQRKDTFPLLLGQLTAIFILAYWKEFSLVRIVLMILVVILINVVFDRFFLPPKQ